MVLYSKSRYKEKIDYPTAVSAVNEINHTVDGVIRKGLSKDII